MYFRIYVCIFIFISYADSLKPSKLPSGKERLYKYNRKSPESDLQKISPKEASFVSRHWLNNILQPKQICPEDSLIVEKINILEQLIQDQFTQYRDINIEYLAWMPQGITADILFIIVIENRSDRNVLRMLINSPFWEAKQISNECLLESLTKYSCVHNKTLDIEDFLTENIHYRLIWRDFKIDML